MTAEELARLAVAAAADDRTIDGLVVTDPDPSDRTIGRVSQSQRRAGSRLPTLLTGISEAAPMSNQPYSEPTSRLDRPGSTTTTACSPTRLSTAYPPDALVTLRFLRDALRRHVRIWLVLAIVGLAGGIASYRRPAGG